MINRIKKFFHKEIATYNDSLSYESVVNNISTILKSSVDNIHFSDIDIKKVSGHSFSIRYNAGGIMSALYGSTLYVEVKQNSSGNFETIINTKIKISWFLYLNFFIFLAAGLAYFIAFFVTKNSIALLNASILMVAVPAFYVWVSTINNNAIKDRYLVLIHKELREIEKSQQNAIKALPKPHFSMERRQ